MVKEASYNLRLGVPVGGRVVNMIRYADDKAIVCNSQNGLQELMNNLNRVTREFGTRISTRKTKVMCISHKGKSKVKIFINGQQMEQVSQFNYLGSTISDDGYSDKEIKSRTAMAKRAFQLFIGKMNLELKKRIVKCLVWSVATCAAETWTLSFLTAMDMRRTEASEMWI